MAVIAQKPGLLDIDYIVHGDALAFQCIFDGDMTADTFAAEITDADEVIGLATSTSYSAGTGKTTLTITLTQAQSESLSIGVMAWRAFQVSGGVSRTILAGRFVVVDK